MFRNNTSSCIGLNHNTTETHQLLQKILSKNKIKDVDKIYETFSSGAVSLTSNSLKSFKTVANLYNIPEIVNNNPFRKSIIKWILNTDDDRLKLPKAYMDINTAEILINLCLKQWPKDSEEAEIIINEYENFEDVYEYNAFKKLLSPRANDSKNHSEKVPSLNEETQRYLIERIENFAENTFHKHNLAPNTKDICRQLCLYGNLLTIIDKYNLVNEFDGITIKMKYDELFTIFTAVMLDSMDTNSGEGVKRSIESYSDLNYFVSRNFSESVSMKCRNSFPDNLIILLFNVIRDELGKCNINKN